MKTVPNLDPRLLALIRKETSQPLVPAIATIAAAARERHGDAVAAVLIYGSCLRDGEDAGKVVDLYLLCDSYRKFHTNRIMSTLNAWLPPNVYYFETPFGDRRVRAKYAVVSLSQFEQLVTPKTLHPYFWARFAQPTAVAWSRDTETSDRVVAALGQSVATMISEARPVVTPARDAESFWVGAFSETYRTELRAERPGRGRELFRTHADRYEAITALPFCEETAAHRQIAARRWAYRRALGKVLSVLRLIKCAFTFHDGPIYLASKIEQHSGVKVDLTPWQQRHPLLAAPGMFWRLYRKGAFR